MVNDNPRGLPPFFGYGRMTTGYFRGNDAGTAPSACVEARKFFDSHLGGARGNCHLIGCYGVYEDGTVGIKTSQVLSGTLLTVDGYAAWVKNQVAIFDRNYDKHLYKPAAANAAFDVETDMLQAVEGTRQVYVPLVRTNGVECAEVNRVVATFPDGKTVTTNCEWTAGMANREVAVSLPDGATWGDVGKTTQIELFSTNDVSVATNFITRVADEISLRFPSLDANKLESAQNAPWGVWTLLEGGAATTLPNCVKEANWYEVTSENPRSAEDWVTDWTKAEIPPVVTDTVTVTTANTVTTNVTHVTTSTIVDSAYDIVITNFVVCTTNYVVYVPATNSTDATAGTDSTGTVGGTDPTDVNGETNDVASLSKPETDDGAEGPGVGPEANDTSKVMYRLKPEVIATTNILTVTTNSVSASEPSVVSSTTNFVEYAASGDPVVETPHVADVRTQAIQKYTYAAFRDRKPQTLGASMTNETPVVSCYSTNTTYNVVEHNEIHKTLEYTNVVTVTINYVVTITHTYECVTNADDFIETDRSELPTNTTTVVTSVPSATTNSVPVPCEPGQPESVTNDYAKAEASVKDLGWIKDGVATGVANGLYSIPVTRSNLVYDVTREQRSGGDIRAFQLRVTGGVVWDERVCALANSFDKAEFKAWCEKNNVACTVVDQRNPTNDASLFTHAKAENGERGTRFLSRNGLSETENGTRSAVGEEFKIELIRPQGTSDYESGVQKTEGKVVGEVSVTDGDSAETILAKLDALLALGKGDPTEGANNEIGTTTLELAFGTTNDTQTLSAVDLLDVFKLTGDFADKAVTFTLCTNDVLATGLLSLVVCDKDGSELPPLVDAGDESANLSEVAAMGVWTFTKAQKEAGVFVKVAFADGQTPPGTNAVAYAIGAAAAPDCPGTVSFVPMGDVADPADAAQTLTNAIRVAEGKTDNVEAFKFTRSEGITNYFTFAVKRMGYTGAAAVSVSLDEAAIPENERGRYVWGGTTKLEWADLENGEKTVEIGLVDDGTWYGWTKLAFRLEHDDGAPLGDCTAFTLVYDDDEPADVGRLAIVGVEVVDGDDDDETRSPIPIANGWRYVRQNERIAIRVERMGGNCSNVVGRLTGAGIEFVSPLTGEHTWQEKAAEDALTKEFILMPTAEIGKSGYADVTVTLEGNGIKVDSSAKAVKFRVLPEGAPAFEEDMPPAGGGVCGGGDSQGAGATNEWDGVQYVEFEKRVTLNGEDGELVAGSLKKISGTVPFGLSVKQEGAGIVVSGVPTKAADATLVYWAKVQSGADAIYTMPVTLHIVITALSDINGTLAAAQAWTDVPMVSDDADGFSRLHGLLNLSVKPNGRMSAKYRMDTGKSLSFSAAGFAALDDDGVVELKAERKLGGTNYILWAAIYPTNDDQFESTVEAELRCTPASNEEDAEASEASLSTGCVPKNNVAWDAAAGAKFAGTYAIAFTNKSSRGAEPLCTGDAVMSLKMANARTGRMTYAGVLANGRTFSGSATAALTGDGEAALTENGGKVADLPVLCGSTADAFTAWLSVSGSGSVTAAYEEVASYWAHRESRFASLSYETLMDCIGMRWAFDKGWTVKALGLPDGASLNKETGRINGSVRETDPETGRKTTKTLRGIAVPSATDANAMPSVFGAKCWTERRTSERDDGKTVGKSVRVGEGL